MESSLENLYVDQLGLKGLSNRSLEELLVVSAISG